MKMKYTRIILKTNYNLRELLNDRQMPIIYFLRNEMQNS